LEHIEKALYSLKDWKKGVGCMGGEPTLHPDFPEICNLFKKYLPWKRRGLWTCGGRKYEQYKDLINETFGIINFNDHYFPSFHQPVLVASEEIIPDSRLRNKLINDCWLQRTWSPTITIKGAFFCEVAATIDLLFNGPGGYPLEPGWWKKNVRDFSDQRERYCRRCSVAIPLETFEDTLEYEYLSKGNAEELRKIDSPLIQNGKYKIFDKILTREDVVRTIRDKKYRNPAKYAESAKDHFWVRNSLWLSQQANSFPYWLKSKINRFFL
jgi:hypothetical protein